MKETHRADIRGTPGTPRVKVLTLAVLAALPAVAGANPQDPTVAAGGASFQQAGSTLTITNTPGAVIEWQSFSIGQGETTRFIQQSAASQVLNRITGQDPSQILGALQSNGQVFLVNPNGIFFGPGAQVDVAGLVASTLNIRNEDFVAGRLNFSAQLEPGAIRNDGSLKALSGGSIYLIAPTVENNGVIQAPDGAVVLAAGHKATLVDTHRPDVQVEIAAPADQAINVGEIIGGHVGIYGGAIRNDGLVSASSAVVGENGRIVFKAASSVRLGGASRTLAIGESGGTIRVEADGTTVVDGVVKATGTAGAGGSVAVLGDEVQVGGTATIDASGSTDGGTVLVGGGFQGADPSVRNARATTVGEGAMLSASAGIAGDGGRVIVWSDDTTHFAGQLTATGGSAGGDGGFAEISGKQTLSVTGTADLSAPRGRTGDLLFDPGSVLIDTTNAATGAPPNTFTASLLSGQLAQANVTIRTSDATNGQAENITISGNGTLSWATANTLTLIAGSGITIGSSVSMPGGGTLAVSAPSATTIGAVTIQGGHLVDNGTAGFVTTNSNTILDGVTLSGRVAVPANNSMRIRNGLTLDGGSILLTSSSDLYYEGSQSIATAQGATGTILLAGGNDANRVLPWAGNTALSLGAGVTVRSDTTSAGGGTITLANGANVSGTNAGDIRSLSGRAITVTASAGSWSNTGTLEAAGGTLTLSGAWASTDPGRLTLGTNGVLNLSGSFNTASFETLERSAGAGSLNLVSGTLDNSGDVLVLDTTTGTLNAGSSAIVSGGRIQGENGRLVLANSAILDGVTLASRVDVAANNNARLRNGLTFDGGSILLTSSSDLYYEGSQSIATAQGATGTILLAGGNDANRVLPWTSNTALSLGAGVTVRSDTTSAGGGTITLANGANVSGTNAGDIRSLSGRAITVTASAGSWSNTGTLEAAGGTLTLSGAWASTDPGRLTLGTNGVLNLSGSFNTASFETLERSAGAGSLNLVSGTLDNSGDVLVLDTTTGTLNAGSSAIVSGGRIQGENGRLVLANSAILDGVTLASRVDVAANNNARLRNGLTFDGGSILLTSSSDLYYEGSQSIATAQGATGTILLAGGNDANRVLPWTSNTALSLGAGVTVRSDTTSAGGGTITLANGANVSGTNAGDIRSLSGRAITVTASAGSWSNTGTLEAAGGTLTLSGAWASTDPGRLTLGTNGVLNLSGSFNTASFETLERSAGAGSLNLVSGTLDNSADVLVLDATTGTLNAGSSAIVSGGRIQGENGRLVLANSAILDGVTLASRVDVAANNNARLRNGLTFDGGSILLTSSSDLYYEGSQSIATAQGATGTILLAGGNDANRVLPWTSNTALSLGAGVTVRSDTTSAGGGTITLANGPNVSGTNAGDIRSLSGRTITVTASSGSWTNTGTLEAAGGTLTLSGAWASTAPGRLALGTNGVLNLSGSFNTASFETLDRNAGAGSLNVNGTLDNTNDLLTFDAAKGTVNLVSNGTVRGGTVSITDGALNVVNGFFDNVTLDSDLVIDGSSQLRILGALTLANDATLQIGGPTNGTAYVYQGNSAAWSIEGAGTVLFGGTATSAGRNLGSGSAPLTIGPEIVLRAAQTGSVDFGNGGSNQGTLLADTAGRTLSLGGTNWVNAASGTIDAPAGTINASSLLRNDGTMTVTGGVLNINLFNTTLAWSNPGTLRLDTGTLELGGTLTTAQLNTVQRPVDADRGTYNVRATIDNTGDTLTFDAAKGTVNLVSNGTVRSGTVSITDGALNVVNGFFDNVTLDSDLVIDGSSQLRILGALTLANDATLQIGGPTNGTAYVYQGNSAAWSIEGAGTVLFGGTATSAGRNLGSGSAPLTIGPEIVLRADQTGTVDFGNGGSNQGTLLADTAGRTLSLNGTNWINAASGTIDAPAGTINASSLLRNDGTMTVTGGVLNINLFNTTLAWSNPGTLRLDTGTLELGGTLTTAQLNTVQRPVDADRGTYNVRATIDNTGDTLTFDAAKGTVNLVSNGTVRSGTVSITDGALNVVNGFFDNVTLDSDLVIDGSSQLRILGALTLANDATLQIGGPTNGTAYVYQGNSAAWSIEGAGTVLFGGTATSAGRNLGSGSAPLTIGPEIVLRADQTGTVDFGNGGTNQGTILADTAGRTLSLNGTNWINGLTGIITAGGGIVDINSLLRNDGTLRVDSGSLLVNDSTNTFAWTNPGAIVLDAGTLVLGGLMSTVTFDSVQRPVDADRGTLNVVGTIANTGNTLVIDSAMGTVNLVSGRGTIDGGTVDITDGALRSPNGFVQDVTLRGSMVLDGNDQLRILGTLTLENDATIQIGGDTLATTWLYGGGSATYSILGQGRIVFGGSTAGGTGSRQLGWSAQPLSLGPDISVIAEKSGTITFGTGGTNQGTVVSGTAGQSISIFGTSWTNPGTLRADQGGTFSIQGLATNSGLIDLGTGSTLSTNNANLVNTGIIQGSGRIDLTTDATMETLTNRGTIRPGSDGTGFLTVDGNLSLDTGSILVMEIQDRSGRGAGYDSLTVTGALGLGGQIQIVHLNGFTPGAAELFNLVSAASTTGSTANVGLSGASTGYGLLASGGQLFLVRGDPGTINVWNTDGNGDWAVASNWSLGRTPLATDRVLIDRGPANPTVTVQGGSQSAGSVIALENVTLSAGTLTIAEASEIRGTFSWTGGTLAGAGALTLAGTSSWSSGTLNGSLRVAPGTTLTWTGNGTGASGGAVRALGTGTLVNDGTIALISGHTDITGNAAIVNNGLFDIQAATNIGDRWTGTGTVAFTNSTGATLRSTGGGEVAIGSLGIPGGTANFVNFTNAGTIDVQSGVLRFNIGYSGATGGGTFTSSGAILVAQDARVDFGGAATLQAGSTLSGAGDFSTSLGADVSVQGAFALGGNLSIAAGSATFAATSPMSVASITVSGGAATFDNATTAGALALSAGALRGTGQITLTGDSVWSGGTLSGNVRVGSGVTLTLNTGDRTLGGGTLLNDGTILWTQGHIDIAGNAAIENNGTFDAQFAGVLGDRTSGTGTLAFTNSATGTLLKSTGTGTTTIGSLGVPGGTANFVDLDNAGLIDVRAGTLAFNQGFSGASEGGTTTSTGDMRVAGGAVLQVGGTFNGNAGTIDVAAGGTFRKTGGFTNQIGGTLLGSGTYDVGGAGNALVNEGTLLGAGGISHMRVNGDVVLADNSVVNVRIGGTTAGTDFDLIEVGGALTAGGSVNATLANGYTPGDGDRFPFISASSVTGTFSTAGLNLPDNFRAVYTDVSAGLLFGGAVCLGSICWDNSTGDGLWSTAANWTLDRLPQAGDIVVVDGGGGSLVTFNAGTVTVGDLTVNQPFAVTSGSLTVTGTSSFTDAVTVSGGTLALQGAATAAQWQQSAGTLSIGDSLAVAGPFHWTGGTVGGAGPLTTSGTTTIDGSGTATASGLAWNNAGTLDIAGGARLNLANGAVLTNLAGATLQLASTHASPIGFGGGNAVALINAGTLVKSAATDQSLGGMTFDNAGTLELLAGDLSLTTSGTHSGTFDIADGSTLSFDNGTHTLDASATLSDTGRLGLGGGTLVVAGDRTVVNPLSQTGGTLAAQGALTLAGPFHFTGGTVNGAGPLTTSGTTTIDGSGTATASGLAWNNAGTLDIAGGARLNLANGAVLTNLAGATLQLASTHASPIGFGGGNAVALINAGTLVKSAAADQSLGGMTFDNAGTLELLAGNLSLTTSGTHSGTFDIADGSTLSFDNGTHTLAAPATLSDTGSLALGGGTLVVAGDRTVVNPLSQTGGTLTAQGALTLAGPFHFTGGTVNGAGPLTTSGTTTIDGSGTATASGLAWNNAGTLDIAGGARLNLANGAVLTNLAGATLQLASTHASPIGFGGGNAVSLINAGTLVKSAATDQSLGGMTFDNAGTLELLAGDLSLTTSGTHSGTFDIADGSTLSFDNGTHTLAAPATLSDTGSLALGGGTLVVAGDRTVVNPLSQTGGTLTAQGALTLAGPFHFTGGTVNGAGPLTTSGTTTIDGSGTATASGLAWNNAGTLDIAGGARLNLANGAVLTNLAGATLQLASTHASPIGFGGGNAVSLINAGTLVKSATADQSLGGMTFDNAGTLELLAGDLSLTTSGTHSGTFDIADGSTLSFDNGTHTLAASATLSDTGSLALGGGTLVVAGDRTVVNPLSQTGGTLTAQGALTLAGPFHFTGGTVGGAGPLTTSGTTTIDGSGTATASGLAWNNAGTLDIAGGARLNLANGAVLTNLAGATLQLASTHASPIGFGGGNAVALINAGTLVKSAATDQSLGGMTFDNAGTLELLAGDLSLTTSGTHSGTFDIADGSTLSFDNGTHTLAASATLSDTGSLALGGGTLVVAGDRTVVNPLSQTGGTLTAQGALTLAGPFHFTGGTVGGAGPLTTSGTTTIDGSGTATASGLAWNNAGTLDIAGGARLNLANGAVLTNLAGATLQLASTHASPIGFGGGNAVALINAGTLVKSASVDQTVSGIAVSTSGLLSVDAGRLTIGTLNQLGGVVNVAGDAVLAIPDNSRNTGSIEGTGTLVVGNGTGTLVNDGVIAPAGTGAIGTLTIDGNLAQGSGGDIEIEVAGTGTGEYDVLAITGNAGLDGALSVSAVGGYTPAPGDTLDSLVVYNSRTGVFTTIALPSGGTGSPVYDPTSLAIALDAAGCGADVCWIGTSGDWAVASNWSTGAVPTTGQSVLIRVAGDQTITVSSGAQSVGSIVTDEALTLTAGSLSIGGIAAFNDVLTITGGTLNANGSTTISRLDLSGGTLNIGAGAQTTLAGASTWTGGTIAGAGPGATLALLQTASLSASGADKVLTDLRIENAGTIALDLDPGGTLALDGSRIGNTGVIDFRAAGANTIAAGPSGAAIANSGTVQVSGTGDGRLGTGQGGTLALDNVDGTLAQSGGALIVGADTATFAGSTTIGGSNVRIAGTQHTFSDGSVVSGGPLNLAAGTTTFGDTTLAAPLRYTGGAMDIALGRTLTVAQANSVSIENRAIGGGGTLANEGTLVLNGVTINGLLVNRGEVTIDGATTVAGAGTRVDQIDGTMTLANGASLAKDGGEVNWIGGALAGTGALDLRLNNGATLNLGAGDKVLDGLTLSLDSLDLSGVLELRSGRLDVAGDTRIRTGGTLLLSGGVLNAGRVDNDGLLRLDVGAVSLGGGGTHSGSFELGAGSELHLDGGTHTFDTGAAVSGPGVLVIDGSTVDVTAPVAMQNVALASGEITGSGTLTIGERFDWTGGRQSGDGQTVIAAAATMAISGDGDKILEGPRQLVNDSQLGSTWTGSGAVDALAQGQALSTFVNNGRFTIETDAPWRDGVITNNGEIVKLGGDGIQVFNAESGGTSNAGLIDIRSGSIVFAGSGTQTGTFSIAQDSVVTFRPGSQPGSGAPFVPGTQTLGDGTTFTGSGTVRVDGDGVALTGDSTGATVAGGVTLDLAGQSVGGTGLLVNDATLILSGSALGGRLVNTGLVVVDGDSVHDGARVEMDGGRIEVAQGANIEKVGGTFVWNDGTLAGPGTYGLSGGATFATGGNGQRVIDGAPIALENLAVDAGTLELRSGSLTVGGPTTFATGSGFIVNGGTATLFGPAQLASLTVNGGVFDARNTLAIGSLAQTGGEILGGGALTVTKGFDVTGGTFAQDWDSVSITQAQGDLDLDRALTAETSLSAVATNGIVRVTAALASGGDLALEGASGVDIRAAVDAGGAAALTSPGEISVRDAMVAGDAVSIQAGSLMVAATSRATGIEATGGLDASVDGNMTVSGGSASGATATVTSGGSPCTIDVAGDLTLTGGSAAGTGAEIAGSPSVGTADSPIAVLGVISMTSGSPPSPARISVTTAGGAGGEIRAALPNAAQGQGIIVDGQSATSAGASGFFVNGAPAVLDENLFIAFGGTAAEPSPPALPSGITALATPLTRNEDPVAAPAAEAQVAADTTARTVAVFQQKTVPIDDDEPPVNSNTQRRLPECR